MAGPDRAYLPHARVKTTELLASLQAASDAAYALVTFVEGSEINQRRADRIRGLVGQASQIALLLDEHVDRYARGPQKYRHPGSRS